MRINLTDNVVHFLHLIILFLILFVSGTILSSAVNAGWTNTGNVNGVQVYRDNDTGLEWTVSLSRVSSFGEARKKVARLGFRLPTHREFRSLEKNGGIRRLDIRAVWGSGFYWEASGRLVSGYGGNFKSLLGLDYPRIGDPYAIGVRECINGEDDEDDGTDETDNNNNINNNNIRVLFVCGTKDDKPEYQNGMAETQTILYILRNKASLRDNFITLKGNDANGNNILKEIRKLCREVGKNGAVLVYYAGHGTTVKNSNGDKIHCLAPFATAEEAGSLIPRSVIYDALITEKIRFVGLVTDSCSNVTECELRPDDRFTRDPGVLAIRSKTIKITKFEAMLRYARGSIDIGSSDPDRKNSDGEDGQFAFYTANGSIFTYEFAAAFMNYYVGKGRFSKDDLTNIMEEIETKVNSYQKSVRNMKAQGGQNIRSYCEYEKIK
ncbi:MAG: caspase family protein [Planctomycetaceae bacterium]|jgi:hypothetical protein|nr:caspase family protein [Planctomycetaceae bacterium]